MKPTDAQIIEAIWTCPKCGRDYRRHRERAKWITRGHCPRCEVESWPVEQRKQVEAAFSESFPRIVSELKK